MQRSLSPRRGSAFGFRRLNTLSGNFRSSPRNTSIERDKQFRHELSHCSTPTFLHLVHRFGLPILSSLDMLDASHLATRLGEHFEVALPAVAGWHTPASRQTLYSLSVAPFVHDTVHQPLAAQLISQNCCRSPLGRAKPSRTVL
jgi:hypothetical protein